MIEFSIKTLDSNNHQFSVDDDITIQELKEKVKDAIGIETNLQRLIFCGRVLQDDKKLSEYDVEGKVVHLVQRAPPSPESRNTRTPAPSINFGAPDGSQQGIRRIMTLAGPPSIIVEEQHTLSSPTTGRLEFVRRLISDIKTALDSLRDSDGNADEIQLENIDEMPDSDTAFVDAANSSSANDIAANAGTANASTANDASAPNSSASTPNARHRPTCGTRRLLRPQDLGQLLEELNTLHAQFVPYQTKYMHLLRAVTNLEALQLAENDRQRQQRIVDTVSDIMHSFAHAYHAISDINFQVGQPRLTSDTSVTRHVLQNNRHLHRQPMTATIGTGQGNNTATQTGDAGVQNNQGQEAQTNSQGQANANAPTNENLHMSPDPITYQVEIETRMPIAFALDNAMLNGLINSNIQGNHQQQNQQQQNQQLPNQQQQNQQQQNQQQQNQQLPNQQLPNQQLPNQQQQNQTQTRADTTTPAFNRGHALLSGLFASAALRNHQIQVQQTPIPGQNQTGLQNQTQQQYQTGQQNQNQTATSQIGQQNQPGQQNQMGPQNQPGLQNQPGPQNQPGQPGQGNRRQVLFDFENLFRGLAQAGNLGGVEVVMSMEEIPHGPIGGMENGNNNNTGSPLIPGQQQSDGRVYLGSMPWTNDRPSADLLQNIVSSVIRQGLVPGMEGVVHAQIPTQAQNHTQGQNLPQGGDTGNNNSQQRQQNLHLRRAMTTTRAQAVSLAHLLYDRFLQCDSHHARRHLQRRREQRQLQLIENERMRRARSRERYNTEQASAQASQPMPVPVDLPAEPMQTTPPATPAVNENASASSPMETSPVFVDASTSTSRGSVASFATAKPSSSRSRAKKTDTPTRNVAADPRMVSPMLIVQQWGEDWVPVFTRDQQTQRAEPQEPYSDAYLFGMPARKRLCVRQNRPPTTLDGFMTESAQEASDRTPARDMSSIRSAFREHVRNMARDRAATSEDYDAMRYSFVEKFLGRNKPKPDQ